MNCLRKTIRADPLEFLERDSYLLEFSRYVVLNPARAAMVKHTRQWKWSSCHAMIGIEPKPEWLQAEWLLSQFQRRGQVFHYHNSS